MRKDIFEFGHIVLNGNDYNIFIEIIKDKKIHKSHYRGLFKLSHFNLIGNNKYISINLADNCYCKYGRYRDELSMKEREDLIKVFESTDLQKRMTQQWNDISHKYISNIITEEILSPKKYLYIWEEIEHHCFEQMIFCKSCSEWAKTEYNILDDKYEFLLFEYFYDISKYGPHIWLRKKRTNEYTAISLISNKYIDITNREYYPCTYQYEKWKYKYNLKQFYLLEDECKEFNKKMHMHCINDNSTNIDIFGKALLLSYYDLAWVDKSEQIDPNSYIIPDYNTIIRE